MNLKLRGHGPDRVTWSVDSHSALAGRLANPRVRGAGLSTARQGDKSKVGRVQLGGTRIVEAVSKQSHDFGTAEEKGAVSAKGMQTVDLGETRNDSHFQIVKGKST